MGSGRNQRLLKQHVDSCKKRFTTVDGIVHHLRNHQPNYRRMELKTLTRLVSQTLRSPQKQAGQPTKKRKSDEESSSSMDTESPPSTTSDSDLMQSMLRESYVTSASKEKNVEVEEMAASGLEEEEEGKEKGPTFKDLGGLKAVLDDLEMEVLLPFYHPQVPKRLGVNPIAGILLHGPPGCGKTKLAHAIANEAGFPFYKISATQVVTGEPGESEENIREEFSKAYRTAPSIVFIDEIDAIASKRENLRGEMEKRIVTQLMTCMDANSYSYSEEGADRSLPGRVLVIAATNRPDALDPALRRPGRFDREINLGVPDENARVEILSVLTRRCTLEGSIDLLQIARSTPGFVGADLSALVNEAGMLAMRRIFLQRKSELSKEYAGEEWLKLPWPPEDIEELAITMADFEKAVKVVQPSSLREGFSTVPNVTWEDVGGLHDIRSVFDRYIVRRIKYPEDYQRFGVNPEIGILLYGPPGCGKTLIAKAVAHEAGANFIHIKGPEVLNKYVGESELAIRKIFSRARTCSPCVLFFDEVDALTTKRGKDGGYVVERLLNQLLIELDGAESRPGVFIIGATNRPEVMDSAVLRPGRFGELVYVPLPSSEDRGLILKTLARGKPVDPKVDLSAIGRMEACDNLSGADLKKLMEDAAMAALEEKLKSQTGGDECMIKSAHFEQALAKISPSVSDGQIRFYKRFGSDNFGANMKTNKPFTSSDATVNYWTWNL
ncbi:Cell division control protein 48 C [Turnera subulata]|uniref:Cell division control protein 48 C n=1 Tax=Turnera subulata TaxID=218843 RepID=A0A9Q0FBG9_9ROSI|nr:Cell division control protein 48 C [Turnera subulata]